jgi:hypothetical protein
MPSEGAKTPNREGREGRELFRTFPYFFLDLILNFYARVIEKLPAFPAFPVGQKGPKTGDLVRLAAVDARRASGRIAPQRITLCSAELVAW